ncbi:MAG: cysteine--tRNA ligase [Patescibacteria group bacterium]
MKLYNTLSKKIEEFIPIEEGKVRFYHCGPTVYWTQHIGNLRGMAMGDILVRTLRYFGYLVTHVRNYTDVGHLTSDSDTGEDKMEKGAKREGSTPAEIAQKYIDIFESDTKAIHLVEPDFKPCPSTLIPEIIDMVQTLIDKKFAYVTDMAVYFDVSKFPEYTKLSRQKIDMNIQGKGKGDVEDPDKKHFADFALWILKVGSHANALQTWESPWGVGFPGWHIECSVMAKKYLGVTLDIHMGGVEHIPIHHTNEIAQSEAANGVPFVHYWLHNEHLVINHEKMAKSQGTGLSIDEVKKKGYDPLSLRYFYLNAHYRTRQNFTWDALTAAENSLKQLRLYMTNLTHESNRTHLSKEKLDKVDTFRDKFDAALSNDINTPQALAVVWEVVKSNIPSSDKYDLLVSFDEVLGLGLLMQKEVDVIPQRVLELVAEREIARKAKDFVRSDTLRDTIEKEGYQIEDFSTGSKVSKK